MKSPKIEVIAGSLDRDGIGYQSGIPVAWYRVAGQRRMEVAVVGMRYRRDGEEWQLEHGYRGARQGHPGRRADWWARIEAYGPEAA